MAHYEAEYNGNGSISLRLGSTGSWDSLASQLLSLSEFMVYSGVDLYHSDVTSSRVYDAATRRHQGDQICQQTLLYGIKNG